MVNRVDQRLAPGTIGAWQCDSGLNWLQQPPDLISPALRSNASAEAIEPFAAATRWPTPAIREHRVGSGFILE